MSKKRITLVPLGSIDQDLLTALVNPLKEVFDLPVSVDPPLSIPSHAYSEERRQYHSTSLLESIMKSSSVGGGRWLGIVDVDLYVPELNFVFGEADLQAKVAVISLTRLRQEFYGLPSNGDLFLTRTIKEAVHELGHTFGLRHCQSEHCVMRFSNSLMDTDRKWATFCPQCQKKLTTM